MKLRDLEYVVTGKGYHWVGNGFRVNQLLPGDSGLAIQKRFSPFLLLDYNEPYTFKGTTEELGVGAHPHRGFETVTLAFEGAVEHHDNKGGHGIIYDGDVQWMTAGSGLLHKEYHEKETAKNDHNFHMLQLWVNLPAAHKMTSPKYQALTKEMMGTATIDGGTVSVIAGEAFGAKGPASTYTPINMYRLAIKEGQNVTLTEPNHFHTGFLVIKGAVAVNQVDTQEGHELGHGTLAIFESAGEGTSELSGTKEKEERTPILVKALEDAEIVILSGEPIFEPIAQGGPFVMNTREELIQAQDDFYAGTFGPFDF